MRMSSVYPLVIKLLVIGLAIIELWLLLGVPSIMNAFIAFFTVGAIPGTERSLTSNETYLLLTGVFIVAICLSLRRSVVGLFRNKRPRIAARRKRPTVYTPIAHPLLQSHPHQGLQFDQILFFAIRRYVQACSASVKLATRVVVYTAIALCLRLAIGIARAWHWFEPYARRLDRWLDNALHQYAITASLLAFGGGVFNKASLWLDRTKTHFSK